MRLQIEGVRAADALHVVAPIARPKVRRDALIVTADVGAPEDPLPKAPIAVGVARPRIGIDRVKEVELLGVDRFGNAVAYASESLG